MANVTLNVSSNQNFGYSIDGATTSITVQLNGASGNVVSLAGTTRCTVSGTSPYPSGTVVTISGFTRGSTYTAIFTCTVGSGTASTTYTVVLSGFVAATPPTIDSFLATPSVTTGAQTVTLSAAVSDADATVDSISITQLSGTTVTLSSQTEAGIGTNSATASVTFTSPNENGTLEFQVSATDGSNGTGTSQITVVTNASGGTVTPPTGDGYGLEVYGPDGTTPYLRITDRITSILAYLSGILSNTNTSDTYTVPGVRNILWAGAASTDYSQTPRVSISGDVITITRAPGVTSSVNYYFIICGD